MRLILALSAAALMSASAAAQSADQPCSQYSQEFNLYLQYGSVEISRSGKALFDQVAENLAQAPDSCDVVNIQIDAHTDSSGSEARNMHLSRAIAQTIEDYLDAQGFTETPKTVTAHGESRLAKNTRDGVREPLNRRAEIKFIVSDK